jgi:O-antigen/teichoic acid export membrane protein
LFWTAFLTITLVGAVGGGLLWLAGILLFTHSIKIPLDLQSEAVSALPWLVLAVSVNTSSAVLTGALEGRERFGIVNLLGVFSVTISQLAPLFVAYAFGPYLPGLVGAVILTQLITTIFLLFACLKYIPITGRPRFQLSLVKQLFGYGGWVTITTMVSPVLTVVDQFVISSRLGVGALPAYNIPYNLVNRLTIIPYSLSRTLFPRFSMLIKDEAKALSKSATLILAAVMTPIVVFSILILAPFLNKWIGASLTQTAAPVGEILLIGVWVNSIAVVPYALLQGQGRPDLTAKFHLIELPFYIVLLVIGISLWGLTGAAWSWTLRVYLDAILLFSAARISAKLFFQLAPGVGIVIFAGFSALWLFPHTPNLRFWISPGIFILSIFWAWRIAPVTIRRELIDKIRQLFSRSIISNQELL